MVKMQQIRGFLLTERWANLNVNGDNSNHYLYWKRLGRWHFVTYALAGSAERIYHHQHPRLMVGGLIAVVTNKHIHRLLFYCAEPDLFHTPWLSLITTIKPERHFCHPGDNYACDWCPGH